MKPLSRRTCLQRLALTSAFSSGLINRAQIHAADDVPTPSAKESAAIRALAEDFLKKFDSPGLSVAFAYRGKRVYRSGFGFADPQKKEALTVDHRFRIASISKPITSVAIYALIEQGKLKLDDHVFGKNGLLPKFRTGKDRDKLEAITVHHLLTHTAGGWDNQGSDPMFMNSQMDHAELIAWTLREVPLEKAPGEQYAYSNFGYCLLGRIIEKITETSYAEHLRQGVLARCNIRHMEIAGNTLRDRAQNEVIYYGQDGQNPYGMNIRRMDSHGGWLAHPTDLLRFLVQVDGFPGTPDILQPATLTTMTTPTAAGPGYASGWSINSAPNWWHSGTLPGTSTIAVRTARGLCWAGFANTRTQDIGGALDDLMWKIAKAVPAWEA